MCQVLGVYHFWVKHGLIIIIIIIIEYFQKQGQNNKIGIK